MNLKKCIKAQIRKQLKSHSLLWKSLNVKEKKKLCEQVFTEVKACFNADQLDHFTTAEQLSICPLPDNSISMRVMKHLIDHFNQEGPAVKRSTRSHLSAEMRRLDEMLNDDLLTVLLASDRYTPSKRKKTLAMFCRAHLLKAWKYASMSFRSFCRLEINDLERKKNRQFIGLPLGKRLDIFHSELSWFRSSLTWQQQLNLTVYILTLFLTRCPDL